MIEFSAAEIAAITGGTLSGSASSTSEPSGIIVSSAATDSRESLPGGLFLARVGEEADGHDFVGRAFGRGAVLALLERPVMDDDGTHFPAVVVPDTVLAMGRL
ncbi:Mur ligase domain-containing protein, partial [Arthrobacter sp. H5]|uniref:Mur ligase domain-containing protein n=1 Tax=Arthrobacter sp. H5 TaxID=1267973 RepID=UPI00055F9DC0